MLFYESFAAGTAAEISSAQQKKLAAQGKLSSLGIGLDRVHKYSKNKEFKILSDAAPLVWKICFCYAKSLHHTNCLETVDLLFSDYSCCCSTPNIFGVTYMFSSVDAAAKPNETFVCVSCAYTQTGKFV